MVCYGYQNFIRMRVLLIFISIIFLGQDCLSQGVNDKDVDSLYKEDQFYVAVTYNLLGKKSDNISLGSFSTGFHFGFIKDMPINTKRNVAFGLGLGYSANTFNHNLHVSNDNTGVINYSVLEDSDTYTKNKFSMHLVEIPFQFRWRTSDATEYKFWRIYTGVRFGYLLANTIKYKGDFGNNKFRNVKDFNSMQYGLTLSVGYNTWNLHLYYALNPILSKEAQLDGNAIDLNAIKVGLMFYIL